MFITRNHSREENAIGVTCCSYGAMSINGIFFYKHFIPTGLTKMKSKSLNRHRSALFHHDKSFTPYNLLKEGST